MSEGAVPFGGGGVADAGVEFVPVDAGAPPVGGAVNLVRTLRAFLPGPFVEFLDPLVRDRVGHKP